MESPTIAQPAATATPASSSENLSIAGTVHDSAALRRLMDEVRFEATSGSSTATTYDRAHNRHNR
jgi:hypothetical protein